MSVELGAFLALSQFALQLRVAAFLIGAHEFAVMMDEAEYSTCRPLARAGLLADGVSASLMNTERECQ